MKDILLKLTNELPTIAIGVLALLRVLGIDADAASADYVVGVAQSVVGFAVWLLARRVIDGPVTVWHAGKLPAE